MKILWKTVWRVLKKLKIELPYDLAIPFLGIYPEKTKILIQKDTSTPMFTAALFIIAKILYLNVHQETVNKEVVIHTHTHIYVYMYTHTMEYYSAIKKKQ